MERLYRAIFELHESRIKRSYLPIAWNDSIQIVAESAYSNRAIRFIRPEIHINSMSKTKEELLGFFIVSTETWIVRIVDFTLDSEWNNHFNGPIIVTISKANYTTVITIKCGFTKIM